MSAPPVKSEVKHEDGVPESVEQQQPAVEKHVKTESAVLDCKPPLPPEHPPAENESEIKTENGTESVKKEEEEEGPSGSGKGDADEAAVLENPEDLLQGFFSELRQVDRSNEVNRVLQAFKLNPYEQLNLRFDAGLDEVRRQYRKLSLMVHPDKCTHEQAREAFEVLGDAQKFLMDDEKREHLLFGLHCAREEVRKDRKKATKNDSAVRVASVLHDEGRAGVEAVYEQTAAFHVQWKEKARDILARTEWRKRKLAKRLRDEEDRIEKEEKEERELAKRKRDHDDKWEKTREQRVGTWRDYLKTQKGGAKKKKKSKMPGALRPPKIKTNDEDKLYVQRPIGEQFRPAGKK